MANDAFAMEIVAMADEDQQARRDRSASAPWDPSVDQRNTQRMREIVSAIGWPTLTKVGADAEHKAWLLVQHANLEFQRNVLCVDGARTGGRGMPETPRLPRRSDFGARGKAAAIGTQLEKRGDGWKPLPVDDPEGLDARRQAVGLEPITEYLNGARRTLG